MTRADAEFVRRSTCPRADRPNHDNCPLTWTVGSKTVLTRSTPAGMNMGKKQFGGGIVSVGLYFCDLIGYAV